MSARTAQQPRRPEAEAEHQGVLRHARSLVKNPPRGASIEHQEAAANVLLEALDQPSLPAAERTAIVRAVLDLGYPWALRLQPEDLAQKSSPVRLRHGAHAVVMALLMVLATFTVTPTSRQEPPRLVPELAPAEPPEFAPRPRVTVQFSEAAVVSGSPRLKQHLPKMVPEQALALEVAFGDWERVIELAHQCRRADPLRLDCLAEEAAAHSRLAQQALRWEQAPRERALASLNRLEHERSARALLHRYLSIAPSTDRLAPKLVQRLREAGDWVEWNPEAADRELEAISNEPWQEHGCLNHYLASADAFEVRALRTHHEDDLAQVEELRLIAEESRTCRGPGCVCSDVVHHHF